jgi:hypothetical protein
MTELLINLETEISWNHLNRMQQSDELSQRQAKQAASQRDLNTHPKKAARRTAATGNHLEGGHDLEIRWTRRWAPESGGSAAGHRGPAMH